MDSAIDDAFTVIESSLLRFEQDLIDNEDLRDEVRTFLEDTFWDASDAFSDAQNDLWALSYDQQIMWDALQALYEVQYVAQNQAWIQEEVDSMREDVSTVEAAFEMLEGKISHEGTLKKIEEVLSVLVKATVMLDEIESSSADTDSQDDMYSFWDDMDKLGRYVEPRLESVLKYVEENEDELALSDADWELLDALEQVSDRGHGEGQSCYNCDRPTTFMTKMWPLTWNNM